MNVWLVRRETMVNKVLGPDAAVSVVVSCIHWYSHMSVGYIIIWLQKNMLLYFSVCNDHIYFNLVFSLLWPSSSPQSLDTGYDFTHKHKQSALNNNNIINKQKNERNKKNCNKKNISMPLSLLPSIIIIIISFQQ